MGTSWRWIPRRQIPRNCTERLLWPGTAKKDCPWGDSLQPAGSNCWNPKIATIAPSPWGKTENGRSWEKFCGGLGRDRKQLGPVGKMVGASGFEPEASCAQDWSSSFVFVLNTAYFANF